MFYEQRCLEGVGVIEVVGLRVLRIDVIAIMSDVDRTSGRHSLQNDAGLAARGAAAHQDDLRASLHLRPRRP